MGPTAALNETGFSTEFVDAGPPRGVDLARFRPKAGRHGNKRLSLTLVDQQALADNQKIG
jgi:hypothetical protein